MSRSRQALGRLGEQLAADWYEANGYVVVARNWRNGDGELDLVVRREGILVFCEVKARSSSAYGSPAEAVTVDKQRRVRHLAMAFLDENRVGTVELRFDVVAVLGGRVEVIEAAF